MLVTGRFSAIGPWQARDDRDDRDRDDARRASCRLFHRPVPTADIGFVHRDFNPGNVLWVRSRLSGLVDWQWACVGPRSVDPAHCRLNLFQYNPTMADDVRTVWEQRSGLTFDPWADLASIIGTLDYIQGRRDPTQQCGPSKRCSSKP